jgi:hypothetical protein
MSQGELNRLVIEARAVTGPIAERAAEAVRRELGAAHAAQNRGERHVGKRLAVSGAGQLAAGLNSAAQSAQDRWQPSDAIELSVGSPGGATRFRRKAIDLKAMAFDAETVFRGHVAQNLIELWRVKLDQLAGPPADEMVVLGIAVVVFVEVASVGSGDLAQQPGVFQRRDCSIHGRAAHPATVALRQPENELIDIEMLVIGEDFFDDRPSFRGQSLRLGRQILPEFFDGTDRDLDGL